MARFTRYSFLSFTLALPALFPARAGSIAPPDPPVINGHVTPAHFRGMTADPALQACAASECSALRSLLVAYDRLRRFYTPNTMARSADNPPSPKRPESQLPNGQGDSPEQQAAIRADLVVIARDVPSWSYELLTVEIARLADPTGHTTSAVIDAIPRTPALHGLIEAARERCEASDRNKCEALIDPKSPGSE